MGNCYLAKKNCKNSKQKYIQNNQEDQLSKAQNQQQLNQQNLEVIQKQEREGYQLDPSINQIQFENLTKYPQIPNQKLNSSEQKNQQKQIEKNHNQEFNLDEYMQENKDVLPDVLSENTKSKNFLQNQKIQCPSHKDQHLELLNMDESIEPKLMCYQCQYEQKKDEKQQKKLKDFFQMSNQEYLNTLLKFQEPQISEIYQKWIKKEYEFVNLNKNQLIEIKTKIVDFIDKQIQQMDDSMNRFKKSKNSLNQQHQNCYQASFQQLVSHHYNSSASLEKKVSNLLTEQSNLNRNLEAEFKKYFESIKIEIAKQNDILKTTIDQLKGLIPNSLSSNLTDYYDYYFDNLITDINILQRDNYYSALQLTQNSDKSIRMIACQDSCKYQYQYKLIFNYNKKYEILFDIKKNHSSNYINFSLNSSSNGQFSYFTFSNENMSNYPNIKVEKGQSIVGYPVQTIENLKLQISLKDRVYKCKFAGNVCSNNSNNEWINLDSNQNYYFGIYIQSNYGQVELLLKSFRVVIDFED